MLVPCKEQKKAKQGKTRKNQPEFKSGEDKPTLLLHIMGVLDKKFEPGGENSKFHD